MTLHFSPYATGVGDALVQASFADAVGDWVEMRADAYESDIAWAEMAGMLAGLGATEVRKEVGARHACGVFKFAAKGGASVLHAERSGDSWYLSVGGETAQAASATLDAFRVLVPQRPSGGTENTVDVRFWMAHPMQVAVSRTRPLPRLDWAEVASNYPEATRAELDRLTSLTTPPPGGNLLVLHGPPGTGKTRFLQTLAGAWSSWCDVHFVVDADEMFNTALYLHTVALGEDLGGDTDRWRLVVVEDGDEFIAIDGKQRSGAAVARLLNVADGLIGQGLKVMLLVSTNVEQVDFSAAIIRAGRCGALVEFPPFPADEADAWAAERGVTLTGGSRPRTLAELYHPGG